MDVALPPGLRTAGILLHPTSLPSSVLGQDVYRWLDLLHEVGIGVWQMLPLGYPLIGRSPYQCASAFAIYPKLFPPTTDELLKPSDTDWESFSQWYAANHGWVDDFALFLELKKHFNGQEWMDWPEPYRQRDPAYLVHFRQRMATTLQIHVQQQFRLWQQWQAIRQVAKQYGIRLFGDMPIFVAQDSADVWAHPELFLLRDDGMPEFVTGVPPDYFSETGQRWGNPHYHWETMRADNFKWWRERLRYHFEFFDLVRIDHFRGLETAWMIDARCETALEGHWEKTPGSELLACVQSEMGVLPLVAEDLGIITPEVIALRDQYGLPGMSVLQFAFDYFEDNPHKPHNVRENTVYYTGTHDNDTLLGWFQHLQAEAQHRVRQMLGLEHVQDHTALLEHFLETVCASAARLAIMPFQDILGLGSEARMNTPGTINNNWLWRFDWIDIKPSRIQALRALLSQHGRLNEDGNNGNEQRRNP
ncbi:MAG: 4-alpha-glucanotransferase [Proteobacteria bacterium]|nr:MAG: 4-alpha-glucanotransferase [Pseudomonadota bacterium]